MIFLFDIAIVNELRYEDENIKKCNLIFNLHFGYEFFEAILDNDFLLKVIIMCLHAHARLKSDLKI